MEATETTIIEAAHGSSTSATNQATPTEAARGSSTEAAQGTPDAFTHSTEEAGYRTSWETFQIESSRLVERVAAMIHEGNVRRIVVKQDEQTIMEFPLAVGVVGTLLAAPLAALGALAVLLNDCTIEVEREEPATDEPVAAIAPTESVAGAQPSSASTPSAAAEMPGSIAPADRHATPGAQNAAAPA